MHPRTYGFMLLWTTLLVLNVSTQAEQTTALEIEPADLPLRQFVEQVVATNPRLNAARIALDAKKSTRDAESQPSYNPNFIVDAESSDNLNRMIGVSQSLDLSGKREARTQVADSNLLFANAEFQVARQTFVFDLLEGLAQYQIGLAREQLVQEHQELMSDLVELAQKRFDEGDISQVELDLVELAAITVRIESVTVSTEKMQAQQQVQMLTPHTHKTEWPKLPTNIPVLPKDTDPDRLVLQLLEVLMANLNTQIKDSVASLRRTERKPDPKVTVKGGTEDNDLSIGLNVTIPLFVRNSFQHEVNAALSERTESELIADDVRQRARIRLTNATERFKLFRSAWLDWQSTSKENLSRPLQQIQPLWEKGELSTTDYVNHLTKTLKSRESALDLSESLWQTWFEWLIASGLIDVWLGEPYLNGEAQYD